MFLGDIILQVGMWWPWRNLLSRILKGASHCHLQLLKTSCSFWTLGYWAASISLQIPFQGSSAFLFHPCQILKFCTVIDKRIYLSTLWKILRARSTKLGCWCIKHIKRERKVAVFSHTTNGFAWQFFFFCLKFYFFHSRLFICIPSITLLIFSEGK